MGFHPPTGQSIRLENMPHLRSWECHDGSVAINMPHLRSWGYLDGSAAAQYPVVMGVAIVEFGSSWAGIAPLGAACL